jgi:hypothetical protein
VKGINSCSNKGLCPLSSELLIPLSSELQMRDYHKNETKCDGLIEVQFYGIASCAKASLLSHGPWGTNTNVYKGKRTLEKRLGHEWLDIVQIQIYEKWLPEW